MISSWGNFPKSQNTIIKTIAWSDQRNFFDDSSSVLAHGNGRSYGDSCLNNGGTIIQTTRLNHFLSFDSSTGVFRCESGCLLSDILSFCVPTGWTLPVVPGTKFVTVGGAIANDVHGKNHHVRGSFGCHVLRFGLLRSTGELFECSASQNVELFKATIGGIGLTGLILWAEIQLMPAKSEYLSVITESFYGIKAFCEKSQAASLSHEYTVAWLDCQSSGKNFARGLLMKANYAEKNNPLKATLRKNISIPFFMPSFLLNRYSIGAFNAAYFYAGNHDPSEKTVHYDPFFFPLDAVHHWNRVYGRAGFFQYQCVVPLQDGVEVISSLLKKIVDSKQGSFLSVLKIFGNQKSMGILSFPMPGITLALDFANKGSSTLRLLNQLDDIVMAAKGRVYPAKDARMSHSAFMAYYGDKLEQFHQSKDPQFSSGFYKRVMELL